MRYDTIVVGGGPAGATAARGLAQAGARVLLLERRRLPRYKACGGCLSRRVAGLLDFDPADLVEDTITGLTFTYRGREPIEARIREPMAYTVWRDRFDQALCLRAVEAGAELHDGLTVRAVRQADNRVEVDVDGKMEAGDFLVGADGASGVVARDLFSTRRKARAVGLDADLPLAGAAPALKGRVVIELGRASGGYCWAFPKRDVASVGAMVGRAAARTASHCLETFLGAGGFGGGKLSRTHGALIPLHGGNSGPLYQGRALLTGDAAALVDPFLGEGIYYAILSGQLAARAILSAERNGGDLAWYQTAISTGITPELEAAGRLSRLAHRLPWLWFKALKRRPGAIDFYRKVLMGQESYRSFADRVWAEIPRPLGLLLGGWTDREQMGGERGAREKRRWQ
ncbi:MAG: geranylgeranyl reductase family protein [Candidatus Methylomirabilis oxyfera]|nr:geranylgeranyl reductase family protein [Candidatus Methylomirabilis oxyfera]